MVEDLQMVHPCKKTYRPTVQEEQVPCEQYNMTDCIFLSDKVNPAEYGLTTNCSLSDLLVVLLNKIDEQGDEIMKLKNKIIDLQ